MQWVYLDNNATTQPAWQVVAAVQETNGQLWANPSSVHRFGQMVRQRIELARTSVAGLIGARDRNIVFTSGGTESNNLVLRGLLDSLAKAKRGEAASGTRRVLITTKIEHAAIREPAEMLDQSGVEVIYLPVDGAGRVDRGELSQTLEDQVRQDPALVSIQWCNNETGVIQPIAELVEAVRQFQTTGGRVRFHTDATQAVGKIPVDVGQVRVDTMTFSAHKFHGPKGAGMLYVRSGVRLAAQNLGGPHERERRGGTENAAGIIGAGVAADLAAAFLGDPAQAAAQGVRRDRFEREVCRQVPEAVVHSQAADRLWNTSNIGFAHLEAEAILLGLSERGVCASAGAACSSGSLEPSPVLLAMNIPESVAHGSVRFSLSRFTTDDEINQATALVPHVVQRLAKTMPLGA